MFRPLCVQYENKAGIQFQGLQPDWIPNKWDKKLITYCVARGSNDIKGDSIEEFMVNLAFTSWGIELDLKFEKVRIDQKPDFDIRWVTKKEDPYFTSDSILAYCGFPKTQYQGILRFNDDNIWTPDGKSLTAEQYTKLTGRPTTGKGTFKTYNGNQTCGHELGHGFGAVHTTNCADCMLYPYYNKTLFPQAGDLEQLIPKYGARVYQNPQMKVNLKANVMRDKTNWQDKWQLNF